MKDLAVLLLAVLIVAGVILLGENRRDPLPVVHASAKPCPKLPNPCDTVNCNRVETRRIA